MNFEFWLVGFSNSFPPLVPHFITFTGVLSRPVRSSCMSVWQFPSCLRHFLTCAPALRHYRTCTPLPVCPWIRWGGGGHVSSIKRDALHELPRGTVVLAIAHQLITCMASDWLLRHLLHVTPTTSAISSRRAKHFIDTKAVQQGNLLTQKLCYREPRLWTFFVHCKHSFGWLGDFVLRHRILSQVISSFLSLRPAWYFPEITFVIYLSINPCCLRIGRFLVPWMPLFNFTARVVWDVNYALRNTMEGTTGGFSEGAARRNCQEGLTKAVGYVG